MIAVAHTPSSSGYLFGVNQQNLALSSRPRDDAHGLRAQQGCGAKRRSVTLASLQTLRSKRRPFLHPGV
jgi:hypothetical protein